MLSSLSRLCPSLAELTVDPKSYNFGSPSQMSPGDVGDAGTQSCLTSPTARALLWRRSICRYLSARLGAQKWYYHPDNDNGPL